MFHERAERARREGALPDKAADALEEAERAARGAAKALERGDGEGGRNRQAEAQRKLEAARQALGQGEGNTGDESEDGVPPAGHADVPKADAHKGPEEFRRRVIHGLGQPSSGRLKDAIRRYAEGLLR